jgi:hypothetical protein
MRHCVRWRDFENRFTYSPTRRLASLECTSASQSRPGSDEGNPMSRTLHIAAAAKQLNRKLFDNTHLEGCVTVGEDQLDVVVHGAWTRNKVGNFAGYAISWRELPIAA